MKKAPHSERDRNKTGSKLKKDPGVPKLVALKKKESAASNAQRTNSKFHQSNKHSKWTGASTDIQMAPVSNPQTIASLAQAAILSNSEEDASTSTGLTRDGTIAAYARHFKKVVELSDVIIQVLDARDPMGTRSKILEAEVLKAGAGEKKMILVLNKIDLIPKDNVFAWLKYLRHTHPTIPLSSSSSSSSLPSPKHLLTLLKKYRPAHRTLTIGVVGAPNVGKSSLINALFRLRASSTNSTNEPCTVGAKPGQTKEVKEVAVEKGLKILDSPGIVWGDFMSGSEDGGVSVGSLNMIGIDAMDDPAFAVESLVSRVSPETLQSIYKIPPFKDATELLVMIALSRGRLGKGGAPDITSSARTVLHDWNSGVIPYHTVPPSVHSSSIPSSIPIARPTTTNDEDATMMMTSAQDVGEAKILNNFSEPFDLEGLWKEVDREVVDGQSAEAEMEVEGLEDGEMDEDGNQMESDDLKHIVPSKRPLSPSLSIPINQHSFEGRQRHKKQRERYDPTKPIVIDAYERSMMVVGGSKRKEKARRKRRARGGVGAEAILVDDETMVEERGMGHAFSVPLPASDDEDL